MISVVLVTWNSGRYVKRAIDSVLASARRAGEDAEVIVFDNGSSDDTCAVLDRAYGADPAVSLIRSARNVGTTVSRNACIRRARGRYVLVLDADAELDAGCIAAFTGFFERFPDTGVACPIVMFPDGSRQESYRRFPTLATKILRIVSSLFGAGEAARVRDESYDSPPYAPRVLRPDYAISACWMIRKETFDGVGLFDERMFYAPEDVDFCIRAWQAGFPVALCEEAIVVHHCQRVSYRSLRMGVHHALGLARLFWKHAYVFSRRRLYERMPMRYSSLI